MERVYSLGDGVTFDSLRNQIVRNDEIVSLGSREAAILKLLCDNKNQVVNKTDLHDYVWGKVYVSETSLTKAISNLRRSLASFNLSSSEIKTVPKEGYIFIYEEVSKQDTYGSLQEYDVANSTIIETSDRCLDVQVINPQHSSDMNTTVYAKLVVSSSVLSSLITSVFFVVFDFLSQ
ncbi:MAG: winged helix-turn-helix domain-containing protein [Plesiomonas sp.]